jgi:uncharacterized membrane protein (TIGR02234 family)
MKRFAPFALALLLDLLGAGGALLVSTRTWQTITVPRSAPLPDVEVGISGRTVDSAPTALALVALAAVVAVLATRGLARRIVGGVLALAGVGLIWRALVSADAVSAQRARALVSERKATVDVSTVVPYVDMHGAWPVVTVLCGVLVAGSGAFIAWRGHHWQVMSARYEAQPSEPEDQAKLAASLWTAIDRGEDPTD